MRGAVLASSRALSSCRGGFGVASTPAGLAPELDPGVGVGVLLGPPRASSWAPGVGVREGATRAVGGWRLGREEGDDRIPLAESL